jgi:hypothetical protein
VRGQEQLKGALQGARLVRAAVGLGDHEMVVGQPDAEPGQLLRLADAMAAQFLHDARRQRHGAALAALRGLVSHCGLRLLGAFLDRDLRPVQVDVAPAQRYGLAAANPDGDAKHNRNEQSRVPRRLDQVAVWSVSWTVILRRSTLGGLTASAGLRANRFHLTACWRACFTRGCRRNDVGTSGVS